MLAPLAFSRRGPYKHGSSLASIQALRRHKQSAAWPGRVSVSQSVSDSTRRVSHTVTEGYSDLKLRSRNSHCLGPGGFSD